MNARKITGGARSCAAFAMRAASKIEVFGRTPRRHCGAGPSQRTRLRVSVVMAACIVMLAGVAIGDTISAPIRTFTGHGDSVYSVAFSPDGTRVLTGSTDTTAKLWDASTGAELRSFGVTWPVYSAAFSPDGAQVLTGSTDTTATLWDTSTGAPIRTFTGHGSGVLSAVFSPDGTQLLTGSTDTTAKLWAASTGALIHSFTGHGNAVYSVAFSPDGTQVLTGSTDSTAKLWAASTGALIDTFTGGVSGVTSVAFSPDGTQVLTGSVDKTARLWNASTGAPIRTFTGHGDYVWSVAFSPDGTQVLTGSVDKTARLWNASTGAPIRTFTGHEDQVWSVAFSPDGTQVLTGSTDATAKLWDALDGEAPVITVCASNPEPLILDANCQVVLPDLTAGVTATDNWYPPVITQSPTAGTPISSDTLVTLTATDAAGLTDTCQVSINVQDVIAPEIAVCATDPGPLAFEANCEVALPDLTAGISVMDNCGAPAITQSPAAGTLISSDTLVTLTATDAATLTDTCQVTVTVEDLTPPSIAQCATEPGPLSLDGNCEVALPDLTASVTASDNCGTPVITQSPTAGTMVSSDTLVTLTAMDSVELTDTCQVTVTVQDTTAPEILVCAVDPGPLTLGDNCQVALPDLRAGVTATDNCGTPVITQSPAAGTLISSDTLVTLTATDGAALTDTCQVTVTVQDTTAPEITACAVDPGPLTLGDNCQVALPDLRAGVTATDNCGTPVITQWPAAGTLISSDTLVTLTATDGAALIDTCQVTVTVQDTTAPEILVCAVDPGPLTLGGNCQVALPDLRAGVTATDNCSTPVVTQLPTAGTLISTDTSVILTASDGAGLTDTCQVTVSVAPCEGECEGEEPVIDLAFVARVLLDAFDALDANGDDALTYDEIVGDLPGDLDALCEETFDALDLSDNEALSEEELRAAIGPEGEADGEPEGEAAEAEGETPEGEVPEAELHEGEPEPDGEAHDDGEAAADGESPVAGEPEAEGEGGTPILSVAPAAIDFGFVRVGETRELEILVSNSGDGLLEGQASVSGDFAIVRGWNYSLAAGEAMVVSVGFEPLVEGSSSNVVRFTGVAGATVPVKGQGSFEFGGIAGHVRLNDLTGAACAAVVFAATQLDYETVAVTDENGRYRVESIPVGEYTAAVYSRGYVGQSELLTIDDGEQTTLDFALDAVYDGGVVFGVVTAARSGSSLGGIRVETICGRTIESVTYTCADGIYELPIDPAQANCKLRFSGEGYVTESVEADFDSSGETQVDVSLTAKIALPLGLLGVTVVDTLTSQPISGARVEASKGVISETQYTDEAGTLVHTLDVGTYSVRASAQGYFSTTGTGQVRSGQGASQVDFRLIPGEIESVGCFAGALNVPGPPPPASGAGAWLPSACCLVLLLCLSRRYKGAATA